MKKLMTIVMVLAVVFLSQCRKPGTDDNTDSASNSNAKKVKVSCTISLNKNSRSDFSQLMTEGNIRWSDGRECVYLAVHGETPQIIELEAWADGDPLRLEFEGEASEGLIVSGQEYDIWYFGHSHRMETPYYNLSDDGESLTGSIAAQSGRLEDLGYCHIATTKVTAVTENGEVKLNLKGTLVNQIAIALLDLENVEELYGDAILGTEYALEYNGERYELDVTEDNNAKIEVESASGISYVVLLPNDEKEAKIKHKKSDKTYAYTFHNGVKGNKVYYRTATNDKVALKWEEIEEEPETPDNNNHEYVDLGLPSGLLWATCNVGASSPEDYGNYYAWGETEPAPNNNYSSSNCATYGLDNSQLQSQGYIDSEGNLTAQHDAAAANWGGDWRMPTYSEQEELLNNCTWTWTTQNGVNGYKVTSKVNSNYIFLPAAGCRVGSSLSRDGSDGYYWIPSHYVLSEAYYLNFHIFGYSIFSEYREYGLSVRPVCGGDFEGPAAQYAFVETSEVTDITSNSAICGGNVTTDNGSAVTAKGVCWSTNQNPTIEDNKTTNGNGVGTFTSNMTNLEPNTTYYVRAYATNEVGTAYGEERTFKTLAAYSPATGTSNGYGYVDLGLSVKWATCNVGASSPEEYGNYYAWGETTTKSEYTEENSATYGLDISQLQSQGYIDGEGNLTPQYDAAAANWGGDWRMPTKAEQQELLDNCTWTWTMQNGVNGYNVEGPNGNSIFLPAAGCRRGSSLYSAGSDGNYWSSTPIESESNVAYILVFDSSGHSMSYYFSRGYGRSVRPVLE